MSRSIVFPSLIAIVALTCIPVIASDSSGPQPQLSERPQYRLRPNDLIDVSFELVPEYNQSVRVGPDGYISLKSVEPIYVEGQTVSQAIGTIKKAYSQLLHDPIVAVDLKEYEKPFFLVSGEVQHPGKFDLLSTTTATKGVAMAGGFTSAAKHSQVVLYREVPNGWIEVKKLNLKDMLSKGDLAEDVPLRPGDLIFVPKNTLSKIERFIPNTGMGFSYHY